MSLPYNGTLITTAKELRKKMTKQEKKLWYDFLAKYPVRFQRQKVIDRFIVDFFCSSAQIAIEIDGSQHYEDENMAYDKERTQIINCYGVEVIRFSNIEINNNFRNICDEIDRLIKKRLSVLAAETIYQ